MTDLDLDRLGDLWRQPPDAAELAELKRTADAVRRHARWSQFVDAAAAIVVAGVVGLLALRNASVETLIVGAGAILFLLMSQIRQRRLRAAELRSLTGTAEQMLDQSIERVRSTVKRVRSTAILMLPAFALGLLVAYTVDLRSGGELRTSVDAIPGLGSLVVPLSVLVIVLVYFQTLRQIRRGRSELEHLTAMRESYRKERENQLGE